MINCCYKTVLYQINAVLVNAESSTIITCPKENMPLLLTVMAHIF